MAKSGWAMPTGTMGTMTGSFGADDETLAQLASRERQQQVQGFQALEQLAKQQEYAAREAAAQRAFQGDQAQNDRVFQGQLLTQRGADERALSAQDYQQDRGRADQQNAFQRGMADQAFGFQTRLNDQQLAHQRAMAGDQFGYQTKLADQQNSFQRGLQLNDLASRERMQGLDLRSREAVQRGVNTTQMDIARLNDAGETTRAGMSLAEQRYSTDTNARTAAAGMASNERIASMPIQFAREKFAQTFPLFQQALAGASAGAAGGFDPATVTGTTTAPREVYTPQQMDQQVNAQLASNARRTEGQARDVRQSAAARGLSSQSAGTLSQLQGLEAARMGEDAIARREIPFQAAQANAAQATQAASLQEQARQANITGRTNQMQIAASQRNALLAALAGIL